MSLTSTEVRLHLDAALAEQSQTELTLQGIVAAAVATGVETTSAEETKARKHVEAARAKVERLQAALAGIVQAESNDRRRFREADQNARAVAVASALDELQRQADAVDKHLAGYAGAWSKLMAAAQRAGTAIAAASGDGLRPDRHVPRLDEVVALTLYKHAGGMKPAPPGTRAQWLGDITKIQTAGEVVASLASAIKQDIVAAAQARQPVPQAEW